MGDVGSEEPDLGLCPEVARLLLEQCTHVFHVAANISFAVRLDRAIRVNLRGSRAVLSLAARMTRLRAMVHVSTAYVNCAAGGRQDEVQEHIYPLDLDPVQLLAEVCAWLSFSKEDSLLYSCNFRCYRNVFFVRKMIGFIR